MCQGFGRPAARAARNSTVSTMMSSTLVPAKTPTAARTVCSNPCPRSRSLRPARSGTPRRSTPSPPAYERGALEVAVVDDEVGTLPRPAGGEVHPLPLHVAGHGRMLGVGMGAVPLSHPRGGDRERR